MELLKNLFVFLLLLGFYASSYGAVSDVELVSCGVFNDESSNGGDKKMAIKKSLIANNPILNVRVNRQVV